MFKPVAARAEFAKIEEAALKMWKDQKIFQKQRASSLGMPYFSNNEFPKTANRKPQFQHILGWAYQDAFLRFQAMSGKQTIRRGVWNTQGMAVEVLAETRLGIQNKAQLEQFGIDRFNEVCRRSTFDYLYNWEKTAERLGCWMDWQEAPVTHTPEVIEAVWDALKRLWEAGAIEKSWDVLPYCPRCGSTLSYLEAALGSTPVETPSLFIRLPLADDPKTSLLVHSARPWTLSGNVAAAVHPEASYVTVEYGMPDGGVERLILSEKVLERLRAAGDFFPNFPEDSGMTLNRIAEFPGRKLAGIQYLPLFTYLLPEKPAHFVVAHESVDPQDGSGIRPVSPVFSSRDYQIALENDLPFLNPLQVDGTFGAEMRLWQGKFFKDAEPFLIEDLTLRGLVFGGGTQTQAEASCPYCRTPLLDTLRSAWRLSLSAYRSDLEAGARQVKWLNPRMQAWLTWQLADGRDWIISRERSWGTPLPFWVDEEENVIAVGSLAELAALADCDPAIIDLHRPAIDAITFPNPKNGKRMYRVPELVDNWFDLGVLPLLQRTSGEGNATGGQPFVFHADVLCDAGAHIPAWAGVLHIVNGILGGGPAFYNALALETGNGYSSVAAPDMEAPGMTVPSEAGEDIPGETLPAAPAASSSDNLTLDVKNLLESNGTDPLRWYLYHEFSPTGTASLSTAEIAAGVENFFQPLWEIYSFFITFAGSKGWSPRTDSQYPAQYDLAPRYSDLILDRWLSASLQRMVLETCQAYETYDLAQVCGRVQHFVEQTSSWYLRHAHQRFWMAGAQGDKDALRALYYALTVTCRVIAPLTPFFAEELYQNLVASAFADAPESVHLARFPQADPQGYDESLLRDLDVVIALVTVGRSVIQGVPSRKGSPRNEAVFTVNEPYEVEIVRIYGDIIKEDLGVRQVRAQVSHQEKEALAGGQFSLFSNSGKGYQVVLLTDPPDI